MRRKTYRGRGRVRSAAKSINKTTTKIPQNFSAGLFVFALRNFHNYRLLEVAEAFTEQAYASAVFRVLFNLYGKRYRIVFKQMQIVESNLFVHKYVIQVNAFFVYRHFFKLSELRTCNWPIRWRKPSPFSAEIAGRRVRQHLYTVNAKRNIRRPIVVVVNSVRADFQREAYPFSKLVVFFAARKKRTLRIPT